MKSSGDAIESHSPTSTKTLWTVYAVLIGLLGATVLVAFMPMGLFNYLLAALIAVTKAGLVIWFFMHFRQAQRLVSILFASSVFILLIGAILSFADYITRFPTRG